MLLNFLFSSFNLSHVTLVLIKNYHLVKNMFLPVVNYGCESWDCKESWAPKNWCFWTVVLEKTLESPLDCKEIKPVNPKGNRTRIFIEKTDVKKKKKKEKTDVEAEAPILWPSDSKSWLIGKDPDAGKDWRQEEKGAIEYEMAGWHHWLNGHEFEQAPGDGKGQGSLEYFSPWGLESQTWLRDWTTTKQNHRRWFVDMSPSSPQVPVSLLRQSFISQQWVLAIKRQAAKHEFSNKHKDYYFELNTIKTQQIPESSSTSPSIA